jgi:hypothetical protein
MRQFAAWEHASTHDRLAAAGGDPLPQRLLISNLISTTLRSTPSDPR